jgi:lysophospholipase L1-like esterase
MRLLARLDRSALRALVVQWCWNDAAENRVWAERGGVLPTTSEADWKVLVAERQRSLRYWPGKHLATLVRTTVGAGGALAPPPAHASPAPGVARAVDDLLAILRAHAALVGDAPILVVPFCRHARAIASALEAQATDAPARFSVVLPALAPAERYPLDGHPNAAGHATVAARVIAALAAAGVTSDGGSSAAAPPRAPAAGAGSDRRSPRSSP